MAMKSIRTIIFEILMIKSTTMASMYGFDLDLPTFFYSDASGFAAGLAITQVRKEKTAAKYPLEEIKTKGVEQRIS